MLPFLTPLYDQIPPDFPLVPSSKGTAVRFLGESPRKNNFVFKNTFFLERNPHTWIGTPLKGCVRFKDGSGVLVKNDTLYPAPFLCPKHFFLDDLSCIFDLNWQEGKIDPRGTPVAPGYVPAFKSTPLNVTQDDATLLNALGQSLLYVTWTKSSQLDCQCKIKWKSRIMDPKGVVSPPYATFFPTFQRNRRLNLFEIGETVRLVERVIMDLDPLLPKYVGCLLADGEATRQDLIMTHGIPIKSAHDNIKAQHLPFLTDVEKSWERCKM